MVMKPALRKFVLTAHITFAVGWLAWLLVSWLLAIAGLTSQEVHLVRSAYLFAQFLF